MDQPLKHSTEFIFLYGPPGAGKTTLGRLLAESLDLPFSDLDGEIEAAAGTSIAEIFAREGEPAFRGLESRQLQDVLRRTPGVVALGGGALLDEGSRAQVESAGAVLCLTAAQETLLARAAGQAGSRPLLGDDGETASRLSRLLEKRLNHYTSFPQTLDTGNLSPEEAVHAAQVRLGTFQVRAMGSGYDVRIRPGGLDHLGEMLLSRMGTPGRVALVSDTNVAPLYAERAVRSLEQAGFEATSVVVPGGESHKTVETAGRLWSAFLEAGLERNSTVVALGGGVVSDLAGFAAATYLRGVRWAVVPTTLLAMADASLGGKTGVDLPQGKNLVGAFHPPLLVLADPEMLSTLPVEELRNGMAEVVKHGILADPELLALCAQGWEALQGRWDELVRRAMAVKIGYIEADPYEKGKRAALNFGHTVGHGLELASDYALRHGEAVAIGMVVEAHLAERTGLAQAGLADAIAEVLRGLGLRVQIPAGLDTARIVEGMRLDKKRRDGRVQFALPVRLGEVRTGVKVDVDMLEFLEEQ